MRPATGSEFDSRASTLAWVALFLAAAGLLQILTPVPWDADTAYHAAVGQLIARHGILRAFPWTPFSWLANHYADKELLFHLLFVPLSGLPWTAAAKIVGTLLGGAQLATLYAILRAERVPRAGLWVLAGLISSGAFLMRFALVRPHLLAVSLALLIVWAAARVRLRWLAGGCVLYPLAYVAWHSAWVLVILVELARWLGGSRPNWRPPAVAAIGVAAGLVIHPNFPEILRLFWIQNFEILVRTAWAKQTGFELGTEFGPFSLAEALRFLVIPLGFIAAALVLAWRRRREDVLALAFALCAAAFAVITLRTQRFIEYLAPFAAAAIALAARRETRAAVFPSFAAAAGLLFTGIFGLGPVRELARRGEDIPAPMAEYLREKIPEGSQIFTCEWGLTGELMQALPDRRFMVALDPVFFFELDPDLYRLWFRLVHGGSPSASRIIRERFGARFAICFGDPSSAPLRAALDASRDVRPLLHGPLWYVYGL